MTLNELTLINFKNFKNKNIQFNEKLVCIVGENGIGKTTILDAIHYLSLTKSYINLKDKQNISYEEDFFLIKGSFYKQEEENSIEIVVKKEANKTVKRNSKSFERMSDHIGSYPSVIISPYDRDLIWEGSDMRRKFLDSMISQIDKEYLKQLIKYNKTLAQRNALLKYFANNNTYEETMLVTYNQGLEVSGTYIYNKRVETLKEIIPLIQEFYEKIASKDDKINIEYQSHLLDSNWKQLFGDSLQLDLQQTFTQKGIHKDDLHFTIYQNPLKKTASQGQQKTFLIALKLTQWAFLKHYNKESPILLLDDIFDKLDEKRVLKLIQLVEKEDFGQIFITDTHEERMTLLINNIQNKAQIVKL